MSWSRRSFGEHLSANTTITAYTGESPLVSLVALFLHYQGQSILACAFESTVGRWGFRTFCLALGVSLVANRGYV